MRRHRVLALAAPLGVQIACFVAWTACRTPTSGTSDGGSPAPDVAPEIVPIRYDGQPPPEAGPRTPVHAETQSTRVDTMQLMFAAGEMQTSGEPFAQNFAGRNLAYYDRWIFPVDQYLVPVSHGSTFVVSFTDVFGFSSAVES